MKIRPPLAGPDCSARDGRSALLSATDHQPGLPLNGYRREARNSFQYSYFTARWTVAAHNNQSKDQRRSPSLPAKTAIFAPVCSSLKNTKNNIPLIALRTPHSGQFVNHSLCTKVLYKTVKPRFQTCTKRSKHPLKLQALTDRFLRSRKSKAPSFGSSPSAKMLCF